MSFWPGTGSRRRRRRSWRPEARPLPQPIGSGAVSASAVSVWIASRISARRLLEMESTDRCARRRTAATPPRRTAPRRFDHDRRAALTCVPERPEPVAATEGDEQPRRPLVRHGELHLDRGVEAAGFVELRLQPLRRGPGRLPLPEVAAPKNSASTFLSRSRSWSSMHPASPRGMTTPSRRSCVNPTARSVYSPTPRGGDGFARTGYVSPTPDGGQTMLRRQARP